MTRRHPVATALAGVLIAALSCLGMPAAAAPILPAAVRTAPTLTRVAYGPATAQHVLIGRPVGSTSARRPTVIFVHGGGWVAGSTTLWQDEAAFWRGRGWLTVNVSYRLGDSAVGAATHAQGAAMLADLRAVISLVRAQRDVDRSRVMIVGDSAGGHLAAWAAGRSPGTIGAMMLWSPVASPLATQLSAAAYADAETCDVTCAKLRGLARRADALFGYSYRTTDPVPYLLANAGQGKVPATWIAASRDEWIPPADHAEQLCAATIGRCTLVLTAGRRHGIDIRDGVPAVRTAARRWAGTWAGLR